MKNITKKNKVIYLSFGAMIIGALVFLTDPLETQKIQLDNNLITTNITNSATEAIINAAPQIKKAPIEALDSAVASTPIRLNIPFATSLEGTDIDGQLKSDASGNLIIDLEVRDLFDYFLNTAGEVTPEVALAEIKKLAEGSLPASAVEQAMQVLDEYLLYKKTAIELMSQSMIPADQQTKQYQIDMLESTFEKMKSIRRQTMSADTVTAFFELEEAYGEYTLASIKVQHDDALSIDEKIAMQAFYREKLPEIIQKTEDSVIADGAKHKDIHHAILTSSSDDLKQTLADHNYSEEASNEIIAYQDKQNNFDQRYQQYLLDKQQMSQSGLSEQDQSEQLQALQDSYFEGESELSQARVRDLSS
ncbi:MAG: lipase chaperone LimK [Oleiphilaceae bacterium]|jgi:lipase chaperone LimK